MKQFYLLTFLIIFFLLFSNCTRKEIYFFSKNTSSNSSYNKINNGKILPEDNYLTNFPLRQEESLISSTSKKENLEIADKFASQARLFQEVLPLNNKPASPIEKSETTLISRLVGKKIIKKAFKQEIPGTRENGKRMSNKAIGGLTLGMVAVASLILGLAVGPLPVLLAGLVAIVGLILSSSGLSQINQNPVEYKGKGTARAGIIISSIVLGLFLIGLLYILAFGGF